MVEYSSIIDWVTATWGTPLMERGFYPFDDYNLPYHISMALWNIIGGAIAWLINLLFPGNPVSEWLINPYTNGVRSRVQRDCYLGSHGYR